MMLDLLLQFAMEFMRTLLVDELSGNVRKGTRQWFVKGGGRGIRGALLAVHRRNRDRLFNRLRTENEKKP